MLHRLASARGALLVETEGVDTVIVLVRQAPPLAHATVPCYEEVFVIHIGVSASVRHFSPRAATRRHLFPDVARYLQNQLRQADFLANGCLPLLRVACSVVSTFITVSR